MKLRKLYPPFFWRYLAQRAFHRAHPEAPLIVANAVVLLDSWIKPSDRGLEWGSGRSTGWLAARLDHLVTIEHDQVWYDRVSAQLRRGKLADKVDYRLIPAPAEQMAEPMGHPCAGVADEVADRSLDLVLIDGQMRLRCMQRALDKLKPGGLLVLDGANRYVPNRFDGGFTTVQVRQSEPLSEEWREVLERLRAWRWMNTSDGLWDTRMWVKPS
jgi:predicted O-methyltransferase YrrM